MKFQLVGVAALLIASKFEEIYPPEVDEFVRMTDNAFSRSEVLATEAQMLRVLDYQLVVPTCYHFMVKYFETAKAPQRARHLASFYAEKYMHVQESLEYEPHVLVAICLYAAIKQHQQFPTGHTGFECGGWTPALEQETQMSENRLLPLSRELMKEISEPQFTNRGQKLIATQRKFGRDAYLKASLLPLPSL